MEPLVSPADCERILIVVNPESRLSVTAQANIGSLLIEYGEENGGRRVETFYTEKDRKATQNKLVRDLEPRDLLVVCTGDGGVNMVAEPLIDSPLLKEDGRNTTPILPIQGGYINLGRQQLTPGILDKAYLAVQALMQGNIIEVNPLELILSHEDEADRRFVEVFCVGVGISGGTIHHLENGGRKPFRDKTILFRELASGIAAVNAFMKVKPFEIEREQAGATHSELVRELSVTNSERVGRFRFPVKLTDPEFLTTVIPEKRLSAAIALGRILVRHPKVDHVEDFAQVTYRLKSPTGNNIHMQIGGERGEVRSGSIATIRRLPNTVRFVNHNPSLQNTA